MLLLASQIYLSLYCNFALPYPAEKHKDCHRARPHVCHLVLRHLVQTETPGNEEPGGLQAGVGDSKAAALHSLPEALAGGRDRPTQQQTTQGLEPREARGM